MITRAGHRMLPSLASASVGRDLPIFRVAIRPGSRRCACSASISSPYPSGLGPGKA